MNPLKTPRFVLTWLCAYPADETTSKWKKFGYFVFAACIFFGNFVYLTESCKFFGKHLSNNIGASFKSLFTIVGPTSTFYMCFAGFIYRHKFQSVYNQLLNIHKITNYISDKSYIVWNRADSRIEWMSKMYVKIVLSLNFLVLFASIYSVSTSYATYGEFNRKFLFRIHPFDLPWDQSTPLGYFAEICFSTFLTNCFLVANAYFVFFAAFCYQLWAFSLIFEKSMGQINSESVNERLPQLIEAHNTAKQLFNDLAETFSPFILVKLFAVVRAVSSIPLVVDQILAQGSMINTLFFVYSVCYHVVHLFGLCYFGKMGTRSFEGISDHIYACVWIELPIKQQKNLVMMMSNAQKRIRFHGCGMIYLDLEIFVKFVKIIYSCYMLFKYLTE